jgi:hypothetical protein
LVIEEDEGVTILDYKLARPSGEDPGDYLLQLHCYAAAARALWGRRARVGLLYLRERSPEPRLFSVDDAAVSAELGELAGALARSRAERVFSGREVPTCRALRCGFIERCHS